jgi:hypothetical protein
MNTTNYTSYQMVPWHHKNWFAIMCGLFFAPALLFVLLTGDVYYVRKSELKTYSKVSKILLIVISGMLTLQLVVLVGASGMAGLEDLGLFQSESSFMKSMDGRWSQGKEAVNLFKVEDKLIMIDDLGSVTVIAPSGKFDADNKLMPVQATHYKQYKTKQEVLTEVATRICPDFVSQVAMVSAMAVAYGMAPDKGTLKVAENCFYDLAEKNQLSEKLLAIKASMHNGVQSNLILFNWATVKNSMKVGMKRDDGQPLFNFGFVRKVTPEEGHEITTYPAKLVSRIAMIDSAIDEIPDVVKRDRQARSVAASAEAEVRAAQAAKFKERDDYDAAESARLNGQNDPASKPN